MNDPQSRADTTPMRGDSGVAETSPTTSLDLTDAVGRPRPRGGRGVGGSERAWLVVLLATLLVFGRAVTFDFVLFDDDVNAYANPHLNPPSLDALKYYATHLYYNVYMPVTWTVWILAAAVAYQPDAPPGAVALNPYVFHALSVATHVATAGFVYGVLRRLRFAPWSACAGALVFALHPLQVEAVAWISAYNVVLSGAFGMAAIWLYLRFVDTTHPRARRMRYAWATLAFILALLSKPLAITVPFVIIAIDLFLLRRPWRATLRAMTPWAVLGLTLAVLTTTWQGRSVAIESWPTWMRPFIAADAVSFYLRKLVWPLGLTVDHGRTPRVALMDEALLWKVLLPVVVLAVLWLGRDRWRPMYAGLLIGVAGMLPILGLAPFDYQQFSTVADRYAYVGMLGAAVVAAWLASRVREGPGRVAVAVGSAVLLGALTWTQLGHWRDSEALFARATTLNPHSAVAYLNWGVYLITEDRPAEAVGRLRQAIAVLYDYHDARVNLGTALYNAGDVPAARRERARAVAMYPGSIIPLVALGDLHTDLGEREQAEAAYRKALAINPADRGVQMRLDRLSRPGRPHPPTRPVHRAVEQRPQ